jgi:hypothetical protein
MEDKSKESILKSYLSIKPINTKRAVSLHSSLQKKKLDFSKINNIKKYPQLNTERLLEYKKRKKINIKVTEYPLTSLGKSSLDISKKTLVVVQLICSSIAIVILIVIGCSKFCSLCRN